MKFEKEDVIDFYVVIPSSRSTVLIKKQTNKKQNKNNKVVIPSSRSTVLMKNQRIKKKKKKK